MDLDDARDAIQETVRLFEELAEAASQAVSDMTNEDEPSDTEAVAGWVKNARAALREVEWALQAASSSVDDIPYDETPGDEPEEGEEDEPEENESD
jgi:seryl-tRNA synthetase